MYRYTIGQHSWSFHRLVSKYPVKWASSASDSHVNVSAARASIKALQQHLAATRATERAEALGRALDAHDAATAFSSSGGSSSSPGRNNRPRAAEHRALAASIAAAERLAANLSETSELLAMAREEGEESVEAECLANLAALQAEADELRTEALMGAAAHSGSLACYLEIGAGAGGADACDWVEMLGRMYGGFASRHGGRSTALEEQPGANGVGLRSATLRLDGVARVYGWLQHETGVHRLVRKSPFDSSGKRHTSFAHVAVFAVNDDDDGSGGGGGGKHGGSSNKAAMQLPTSEVSLDTFRAQGAGGQHVNTTESAVRATHIPTGLTAACQTERSQHRNKASALQLLAAKVAKRKADERQAELAKARGSQVEATWGGQQVRSYILSPYRLVKDHRVGTLLREHGSSNGSSNNSSNNNGSKSSGIVGDEGENSSEVLGTVTDNEVDGLLDGGSPLDELLTDVLQAHATACSATGLDELS